MTDQKPPEADASGDRKKWGRIPKPPWLENTENRIASAIPIHPNILSGTKLLVILPLILFGLNQISMLPIRPWMMIALFLSLGILNYLDGAVARHKGLETAYGRFLDCASDYLILLTVSFFCLNILPPSLLVLKLILDLVLMILYIMDRGNTEHRARTGINYIVLLTLLIASQQWTPRFITWEMVVYLLWINITFSTVILLYILGILQKRLIADALSGANLLCGVFSMIFASKGRVDISLLFLMLGAAFDGFDGAAARKFGGTRWGVYSDDVADGVNYGIAPGVALCFSLGRGPDGWIVGIFYSVFTVSRLVFFTLNKAYSNPNYFCGVPSTVGALVAICSLILFENHPVIIGLMVGIACIQMVSFDTHYRHLGRALASNRRIIYGMPVMIVLLLVGNFSWGKNVPVGIILGASLVYGFLPTVKHFVQLISRKGQDK